MDAFAQRPGLVQLSEKARSAAQPIGLGDLPPGILRVLGRLPGLPGLLWLWHMRTSGVSVTFPRPPGARQC